ncbi:MAG TPA: hypothetical protein VMF58_10665 [Rhizomicrobium sp.]|nr:hypothetical protein [Rhizomicrobium sp.]
MGYYIRVLTPEAAPAPLSSLIDAAQQHDAVVQSEPGTPNWVQVTVTNAKQQVVCFIERNEVSPESLAEGEVSEFRSEIADCLPKSAANWLLSYLESVRTIYAFQLLSGTYAENGWEILGSVKAAIWSSVGGIIQADNEGFSNEDGYHILWQFSDDVDGAWWMAVLKDGRWENFKMDLGSRSQRAAFMAGDIPAGVERAD